MKPEDIKVGSCYCTARFEVRKVIEITPDDRVNFVARGKSYERGESSWYPGANMATLPRLHNFAMSVIAEVPFDWDPAKSDLIPIALPRIVPEKVSA